VGRYYDPATDQFLSVDPLVAETGQPYAFTEDDPLNATDPTGMKEVCGDLCGGGNTPTPQNPVGGVDGDMGAGAPVVGRGAGGSLPVTSRKTLAASSAEQNTIQVVGPGELTVAVENLTANPLSILSQFCGPTAGGCPGSISVDICAQGDPCQSGSITPGNVFSASFRHPSGLTGGPEIIRYYENQGTIDYTEGSSMVSYWNVTETVTGPGFSNLPTGSAYTYVTAVESTNGSIVSVSTNHPPING
jgi:hypothetical protein